MILNGAQEARVLGNHLTQLLEQGKISPAIDTVSAYLDDKNPFRLLDIIGEKIAVIKTDMLFSFLDEIAHTYFEGAWVVIATALFHHRQAERKMILSQCKQFVILADIWYAADIFGERVLGPFLLEDFEHTLIYLNKWRSDRNVWVRRSVGVAVHFWAKRTKGGPLQQDHARALLDFVTPLWEENDIRAAKGIGWGLKTLGRYYPDIAYDWLYKNLITLQKQPMAVIRRKALTYLPDDMKGILSS